MNTYSSEYGKQIILNNGCKFTFNEHNRFDYTLINGIYTVIDTQVDGKCWQFPMTGISAILTQKTEFTRDATIKHI